MTYKFDLVLYVKGAKDKLSGKYAEGKTKDSFNVACVLNTTTDTDQKLLAVKDGKWTEVGILTPVTPFSEAAEEKINAGRSPGYRGTIDMTLVGGTYKGEVIGFLRTVKGNGFGEPLRFWSFLEPYRKDT
jgi:hypothetical protein